MLNNSVIERFLAAARIAAHTEAMHRRSLQGEATQYTFRRDGLLYTATIVGTGEFAGHEVVSQEESDQAVWHMTSWGRDNLRRIPDPTMHERASAFLLTGRKQLYERGRILGENKRSEAGLVYVDTKMAGSCMDNCEGHESLKLETLAQPFWQMRYRGGRVQL